MTTPAIADLHQLAQAWLDVDPDPVTRAETAAVIDDRGRLIEHFGAHLPCTSAGIRGPLGPGPNRMNRVVVRLVAGALAARLSETVQPQVVVAYDHRASSRLFAEDATRMLAAADVPVVIVPTPVPTPVLAFAVKRLAATAGVMVTGDQGPQRESVLSFHWSDGAPITEPLAAQITDLLSTQRLEDTAQLPAVDHRRTTYPDAQLIDAYIEAVVAVLERPGPRSVRVAYTPPHGLGADLLGRALTRAGFDSPTIITGPPPADATALAAPSGTESDTDAPTVAGPWATEPGVLDPMLDRAAADADLWLATDPDSGRLSAAVPSGSRWRLLNGDELGCLLAEHLLGRRSEGAAPALVASSVVSSRLLARIADAHGANHVVAPAGSIMLAGSAAERPGIDYVLGYDETSRHVVGDAAAGHDGVAAALVVAEMVDAAAADGRTVLDLLVELDRRHGVHLTGRRSLPFERSSGGRGDAGADEAALAMLRSDPPRQLGRREVLRADDLAIGSAASAPTEGIVLSLAGAWLAISRDRSAPQLEIYGEVIEPPGPDPAASRVSARAALGVLVADAVRLVSSPEQAAHPTAASVGEEADRSARAAALMNALPEGMDRADELRRIVRCIDLTTLEGDDTRGRIRALCATARRPDPSDRTVGPVAAVCVYPSLVGLVRELLVGSGVQTASVAGAFPSAQSFPGVRLHDIGSAVHAGAQEVDIVLNRSAFLDGRLDVVTHELTAARAEAADAHLKVILEVGELRTAANIGRATELAIEAGADTIKTSTGKIAIGATPEAVFVIATCLAEHWRATGRRVGIKISGGVRTTDAALGFVALVRSILGEGWLDPSLFRFGASGLLGVVVDELAQLESGANPAAGSRTNQ